MKGSDYRIQLENYYGPLDLLLYLVRQQEVDIREVSIAEIATQYIQYLNEIQKLNVNIASEFLVMAASLMRMKSRSMVPDGEAEFDEEDLEDPREMLIRNLIEYRRFKRIAGRLRKRRARRSRRFSRPDLTDRYRNDQHDPVEVLEGSTWRLVKTYARLEEETALEAPSTIVYDDLPQEIVMDRILDRIGREESVSFMDLIGSHPTRNMAISYFLGILKLSKRKQLRLDQPEPDGDITITAGPDYSVDPGS